MNPTPEFVDAVQRHQRLVDALGMDHPDTKRAMMLAMELAPPELMEEIRQVAREMGLVPEPDGYLADGSPVYRVDAVAKLHGMSQEEAEAILGDVTAEREALGLPRVNVDMSMVHRRQ